MSKNMFVSASFVHELHRAMHVDPEGRLHTQWGVSYSGGKLQGLKSFIIQ